MDFSTVRMARPKSVSDEEILNAARRVITLRGSDAFTLSEVAVEVGLSRAAIIQRFKSTDALMMTLLVKVGGQFIEELEHLPREPSGDSLLAIASFIGGKIKVKGHHATYYLLFKTGLEGTECWDMEQRKNEAVEAAISRAMPDVRIDHQSAIKIFHTHLTGALTHWLAHGEGEARDFMVARTKDWLDLAGIPYEEQFER